MHRLVSSTTLIAAVGALLTPLAAQRRLTFAVGPARVTPAGTLASYVEPGLGVGATLSTPLGTHGFTLHLDADYLQAGPTSHTRPWGGPTSPYSVDIATGTRVFALAAGPAAGVTSGRLRAGVGVGAGVAYVSNTSAVSGLYDLDPFARATAHSTVTWLLAAGAQASLRVAGGRTPVRLELSVRGLATGPTSIVREDHLLVGQISGVYLYPTAIDTRFIVTRAAVVVGP